MNRNRNLRKHCRIEHGRGLEFGPLDNPVVRKTEGRVYYVDYTSTEKLRARKAADPAVDAGRIVDIDFNLENGPLRHLAEAEMPFDYAIASHVFEHLPNPLGWLCEMESLLAADGVLSLAIPDKRYTFDFGRRLTTAGDLVGYWFEGLLRPSSVQVLDHFMNVRRVEARAAWEAEPNLATLPRMNSDDEALELSFRSAQGEYIDTHCTVWTATQFRKVFENVQKLGLLSLAIAELQEPEPGTNEFLVTLRKSQSRVVRRWNTGPLFGGRTVAQSFRCQVERLSGIGIRLATYGRSNDSTLLVSLRRGGFDGEVVRRVELRCSSLVDNAERVFAFDPIPNSRGERFVVELKVASASEFQSITAYCTASPAAGTDELQVAGRELPGTLEFRTVASPT